MSVLKQEILTDKEVFRTVSKIRFKFLYHFCFFPQKLLKDEGLHVRYLMVSEIFKPRLVGVLYQFIISLSLLPSPSFLPRRKLQYGKAPIYSPIGQDHGLFHIDFLKKKR